MSRFVEPVSLEPTKRHHLRVGAGAPSDRPHGREDDERDRASSGVRSFIGEDQRLSNGNQASVSKPASMVERSGALEPVGARAVCPVAEMESMAKSGSPPFLA